MEHARILQAIVTKYIGPTNTRGARVKATAAAGSLFVPWEHGLGIDDNHARAAKVLADKFKWAGHWFGGSMPDGSGNVFVCAGTAWNMPVEDQVSFTSKGE